VKEYGNGFCSIKKYVVTYEDLEKTGWLYEVGTGFLHTPCIGEGERKGGE
jgi:hypothetical protein